MEPPLPDGWVEKISRKRNGMKYFFHEKSGESSWTRPEVQEKAPPPPPPQPDHVTSTSVPKPLPEGWDEARTPEGRLYYKNHATKTTQWEHPGVDEAKRRRVESDERTTQVRVTNCSSCCDKPKILTLMMSGSPYSVEAHAFT